MSSRYYPIYRRGNPQLRVFLPNFWMKLVKPEEKQPKNIVQFFVPTGMTSHDIRNYLEKIYKIPVIDVKSEIENGKLKRAYRYAYIVKEDDFRRAFVTLPKDYEFEYPDIVGAEEFKKEDTEREKTLKDLNDTFKKYADKSMDRPGVPSWFSF